MIGVFAIVSDVTLQPQAKSPDQVKRFRVEWTDELQFITHPMCIPNEGTAHSVVRAAARSCSRFRDCLGQTP